MTEKTRCAWCLASEKETLYHDSEWGVPVHDDQKLFECLTLESAQAGLSWATILNKREGYQKCFAKFNIKKVAEFDLDKIETLLQDASIVRHRQKIEATINNANRILEVQKEFGSFDTFIWEIVGGEPIQNNCKTLDDVASKTELSDMLCKKLKKHGFKFVGTTICYAFMQAAGMVNDHVTDCFRYQEVQV
ncbi:UNVERIFIED_CONTAM: hypothetical protein GTU68_053929 [Idotea baltica]|nr:hypothetical protein [Idotea baltica]